MKEAVPCATIHTVVRVSAEIELPLCDCNDESEAGLYHLANGLPIKRSYEVQFTRQRILTYSEKK
ncbi:hypothetical protein WN48_05795 [Eufriesea mexicana]|uniref:Uncharacterized protein n=1 Tax=Eufriesea mexicana TaxID=516756 RepID=A0A310SKN1_9HYME|nr:hypothetical protein WN48_05795 [Eufriesea mexicana]